MKFTIERHILLRMLEQSRGGMRSKRERNFGISLSACSARVFVIGPNATAGHEALVFEDGECYLKAKTLLEVLRTYANKVNVIIEVSLNGLNIERFTMPVSDYSPRAVAPAKFQVFPVIDLYVLGSPSTTTSQPSTIL